MEIWVLIVIREPIRELKEVEVVKEDSMAGRNIKIQAFMGERVLVVRETMNSIITKQEVIIISKIMQGLNTITAKKAFTLRNSEISIEISSKPIEKGNMRMKKEKTEEEEVSIDTSILISLGSKKKNGDKREEKKGNSTITHKKEKSLISISSMKT